MPVGLGVAAMALLGVAYGAATLRAPWALAALGCIGAAAWILTRRAGASAVLGIPGYALLERLDGGGMGEVWRARHVALEREVAIKLIRPELLATGSRESRAWIERDFAHEARVTASLSSPHTVRVHDFGRASDGALYYAMDLLDGISLEALVRRFGPCPPERVAFIVAQLCESLAEAHARGLVHGDVKSRNIQLGVRAGAHDFVTVFDFGLARGTHETRTRRPDAERRVCGTPDFLAPEVYRDPGTLRPAVDLYALGCVAYRLLTGKHVFEAETAPALIGMHIEQTPERPAARLGEDVPRELEDLVLDLLAKDPADRPRDALEVARRLRASGLPQRWTSARAQAWWRARFPAVAGAEDLVPGTSSDAPSPPEAERISAREPPAFTGPRARVATR